MRAQYSYRRPAAPAFGRLTGGNGRDAFGVSPSRWREDFGHERNTQGLAMRGARHFRSRARVKRKLETFVAMRGNMESPWRPAFAEA